jgi:hypothetical protein
MHHFEGPVSIVCPEHHAHFQAIGGGGKAGPPTVQTFDDDGGDSIDGDISFSGGGGLNLGDEEDDDDDYGGTGITEFTSDQFEVNERCSYYMNRVPISHENRKAVEFVYMIEADTIVRSQNTLSKPELAVKLLEKYKQLIAAIPANRFGDDGLKATMCKGYYRAKLGSAGGLQDKVRTLKTLVQKVYGKCDLSKLPSGCGIFDARDRYISEKFVDSGGHESEVPDGWWLSDTSCYHLLAALVHKNNPDIAKDPTQLAAPGTRDEQRAQVAKDREKQIIASKMASVTVRGEIDESMLRTKAKLMEQNIELQETEGIEKQLTLLDKFKSSFVNIVGEENSENGKREYDLAVCDLLHSLPFMKKRKEAAEAASNK